MTKRFGIPQPSRATLLSQMIAENNPDLAYASGGGLVSGLTSALKSGLGTYGGLKDRTAMEQYQQSQADLQQQQTEQEKELKEKGANLGYYKLGIDPDRLNEPEYKEQVLQTRSQTPEDIKGEFAYAMNVIKSPQFQSLPKEQQDLWINFANTKAKGYETLYGQSQATALGKGAGELQYAQPIAQAKERGQQIEQLQYAQPIEQAKQTGKETAELMAINPKEAQKEYQTIRQSAREAQNMNNTYTQMEQLLDKGIRTGSFAGAELESRKFLEALGVPTEGLAEGQAFKALGNQLALRMRNPDSGFGLTGNTSDRDVKFLQSMIPNLKNTPEGNRTIIKLARSINNRKIQQMKIAQDYVAEHGYYDPIEVSKQIDKLNQTSMFDESLTKSISPTPKMSSINDIWEAL